MPDAGNDVLLIRCNDYRKHHCVSGHCRGMFHKWHDVVRLQLRWSGWESANSILPIESFSLRFIGLNPVTPGKAGSNCW